MGNWFEHLPQVADELAIVRSMWTTDNDHGAQLQFHTGRHALEGQFPTIGSWIRYGLGSLSQDIPQFVVLGKTHWQIVVVEQVVTAVIIWDHNTLVSFII